MPSINRFMRRMNQMIDQQGWAILTVSPTDDQQQAPIAYTTGLSELSCAELIVAGLHPDVSQYLLNNLARRVVERAQRFTAGQRIGDLPEGYRAAIVEGPPTGVLRPTAAYVRYGEDRVVLQQVVWPDPVGRFPWEPGCTTSPQAQPLIGRP